MTSFEPEKPRGDLSPADFRRLKESPATVVVSEWPDMYRAHRERQEQVRQEEQEEQERQKIIALGKVNNDPIGQTHAKIEDIFSQQRSMLAAREAELYARIGYKPRPPLNWSALPWWVIVLCLIGAIAVEKSVTHGGCMLLWHDSARCNQNHDNGDDDGARDE